MYNKVIAIGNLTRDIEIKYLPNNTPLAKGAIATSHKYKTQSGEQKEEVCFLDFTIFGKIAEVANKYLHKGSKVMLEGRLQFDQWTDNQTGAKRSKHSLMVNELKMLGDKSDNRTNNGGNSTYVPNNPSHQVPIQKQTNTQNSSNVNLGEIPDFENNNDMNLDDIFDGKDCPF